MTDKSSDQELAIPKREVREIAREEAQAVYDELAVEDPNGQTWSLRRFLDFGLTRRQAIQALGYVALGASGATAALRATSGTAGADSTGQEGTQADPLTKVWTHEIGVGDGASQLTIADTIASITTEEGTIDGGKDIPGVPATSNSPSPGFGNWTQPSADRPSIIQPEVRVETDGSSGGEVRVAVDESGGTTADYEFRVAFIHPDVGSGVATYDQMSLFLPAGAQFELRNQADPNNGNSIQEVREFIR